MQRPQRNFFAHHPTLAALVALALVSVFPPPASSAQADENAVIDPSFLAGLRYRMVGPHRGGRVTAVTGVPANPHLFYFGNTGGGVWRSDDAGESWTNLTDGQIGAGGIGAIAVAPSDPNVIYVGTGSACIRGNVSPGIGVYKTTDAGKTWTQIGLREAGQIGRIRVHPADPDLVYVAALGNAFGPNEERGVFRSRDGGATWEKVLYIDEVTGVVDLAINPSNPRILYAGAWRGERKPWTLISGGEDGGVYQSTDGGDSWKKLAGGLPEGLVGKAGVAVSPANPDRVWALVEAEEGGLFRSDDAGKSWMRISEEHGLWERPWYYMHVTPDPRDENTVWVSNVFLYKSVDGGHNFTIVPTAHGDNHALWINPHHTEIMINGDDGGAAVTLNGARTWSSLRNQPTAELYRVTVDDQFPYRLYGPQQDNTSVSVPSRLAPGLISDTEEEFQVGGCESGHIAVDPRDPKIVYAGCYGGTITRTDLRTGQQRDVIAYPQLQLAQLRKELRYRFQWNAPIRISPHDPNILYHASQVVL
ncbi:MAG: WD40/YVTN/BNR-like repeat-containing protein, partial [Acidobacteriota bacterium]